MLSDRVNAGPFGRFLGKYCADKVNNGFAEEARYQVFATQNFLIKFRSIGVLEW